MWPTGVLAGAPPGGRLGGLWFLGVPGVPGGSSPVLPPPSPPAPAPSLRVLLDHCGARISCDRRRREDREEDRGRRGRRPPCPRGWVVGLYCCFPLVPPSPLPLPPLTSDF